jgi:hypothetical protein
MELLVKPYPNGSITTEKEASVESDPVIELLHAAYKELSRLEPLLQQNPLYRRVESLRRLIEEYEGIAGSRGSDPIFGPNPTLTTSMPEPSRDSTGPATVSPSRPPVSSDLTRRALANHPAADPEVTANISPAGVPDPSITRRRRGWNRGNSQAAQIRNAAAPYLREKGKPARGPEIYKAISAKGVEVRGKSPAAVVANALRWSPDLFELTPNGFRLRERSES